MENFADQQLACAWNVQCEHLPERPVSDYHQLADSATERLRHAKTISLRGDFGNSNY